MRTEVRWERSGKLDPCAFEDCLRPQKFIVRGKEEGSLKIFSFHLLILQRRKPRPREMELVVGVTL